MGGCVGGRISNPVRTPPTCGCGGLASFAAFAASSRARGVSTGELPWSGLCVAGSSADVGVGVPNGPARRMCSGMPAKAREPRCTSPESMLLDFLAAWKVVGRGWGGGLVAGV